MYAVKWVYYSLVVNIMRLSQIAYEVCVYIYDHAFMGEHLQVFI